MSQQQQPKGPFNQNKQSANSEEFLGNSSYLARAVYDSSSLQLTIDFKSGSSMTYWPVTGSVWEAFKVAPSQGAFYAHAIKGKFQNVAITKPLRSSSLPKPKRTL